MKTDNDFFVEVDFLKRTQQGQTVSGDVFLVNRYHNRSILVLSDGRGTGVKANTIAQVTASMAMNYAVAGESAERAARTILRTFSANPESTDATFSVVDIRHTGKLYFTESRNPPLFVLRDGAKAEPDTETTIEIEGHPVRMGRYTLRFGDRVVLVSDGIVHSGRMTKRMPEGWREEGLLEFCREEIDREEEISAWDLTTHIIDRAEMNDLFEPRSDMTCSVVYFRRPRRIMVCSGPPYNERKDEILADMVSRYPGKKLICGGTTAQILSRELKKPISVELGRDLSGLPPVSRMEGMDLITEGVLTLSRVKKTLTDFRSGTVFGNTPDGRICRMLVESDRIEFVVGTRINPVHQDPDLPVELELRRNLIKDLALILENKFMKEVKIMYI